MLELWTIDRMAGLEHHRSLYEGDGIGAGIEHNRSHCGMELPEDHQSLYEGDGIGTEIEYNRSHGGG